MKRLTNSQLKTTVDVCVDIGMIGLGSVSIPVVLNRGSMIVVGYGLVISFIFWYIAVRLSREII
ncbi:MAG: hypothetical protein UU32_C0006G0027 [Candidatus Woesebacteria bacterium GW2011_GWB1_41_10]|uniref:Uncharacterized protein n=1 Tax=Candidatus Woesebacteria bacterium GW2011_GWB1_41_10 TaxID=1618577 RepID=A0A0G0WS67_9BACT|nr:MAG: hypothetical protein UU32_C0006G0027 [Candidatus Woesebacteria bacterium GW2011_GWB1_41_10]